MEVIAFMLLFLFIAVSIMVNVFYRQALRKKKNMSYTPPELGIREHNQLFRFQMLELIEHLENSFPPQYIERVKERIIQKSKINLIEWENRWFEWKRYLLISAILRSVPMYSREVDEIWHEMLMFTREYQEFCQRFFTTMLHHAPNTGKHKKLTPGERAWFDLVYLFLYEPTPYSFATWGTFLKQPLYYEQMMNFKKLSEEELIEKYFNKTMIENFSFVKEIVHFFIRFIREQLEKIDQHVERFGVDLQKFKFNRMLQPEDQDQTLTMLTGFLFVSQYHPNAFQQSMKQLYKPNSSTLDRMKEGNSDVIDIPNGIATDSDGNSGDSSGDSNDANSGDSSDTSSGSSSGGGD